MYRPTVEQLEQREVFSVSPASAAIHAAGPPVMAQIKAVYNGDANFNSFDAAENEIAIETLDFLNRNELDRRSAMNQGTSGILIGMLLPAVMGTGGVPSEATPTDSMSLNFENFKASGPLQWSLGCPGQEPDINW